jgi:ATP-dependent Clp protease ATP-binding subunit ClpC
MQVTYSEGVHRLLADSQDAAGRYRHRFVHTEHLLIGLLNERSSGTRLLKTLGYDRNSLRKACEKQCKRGEHAMESNRKLTQRVQEIMAVSKMKMTEYGHEELDTRHILMGILMEPDGIAGNILREAGLTVNALQAALLSPAAAAMEGASQSQRSSGRYVAMERPLWKRFLRV